MSRMRLGTDTPDAALLADCLRVAAKTLAMEAMNIRTDKLYRDKYADLEDPIIWLNAAARCLVLAERCDP